VAGFPSVPILNRPAKHTRIQRQTLQCSSDFFGSRKSTPQAAFSTTSGALPPLLFVELNLP
jgi:hypothetical protein